ncbi:hypothetical protein D3C85_1424690 [compost metagenome]
MLKIAPTNVPKPSARKPLTIIFLSIGLPTISPTATNIPVASMKVTNITMDIAAIAQKSNFGIPK